MKRWIAGLALLLLLTAAASPAAMARDAGPLSPAAPTASPSPSLSPTLSASTTLSPTPSTASAHAPAPTPFSIAWFGDTQTASYNEPKALAAMGEWVAANYAEKNIVRVVQTGDLVEAGNRAEQWAAFYAAYDAFYGKVPYVAVTGNHDIGVKEQNYDYWLPQRFLDELPAAQKYMGGLAVYDLFTAGGTNFIIAGVGWGCAKSAAPWLRKVLLAHSDRVAILLCHGYFLPKYGIYEEGVTIRDGIVARCPNVRLVLCGHYRGTAYRQDEFTDANGQTRTVRAMMLNFQGYMHHNAQMRLLTFDPADHSIHVETFNAMSGRTYRDDTLKVKEFTLENAY